MGDDAAEAKAMSVAHMTWMIATLKEHDGKCTYEVLVEAGEHHHCDTVGALLKVRSFCVCANRLRAVICSRRAPRRSFASTRRTRDRQILKNRKVIKFKGQFLMYPMHKDTMVKLKNPDYDPSES
jgi:hypothetical protein